MSDFAQSVKQQADIVKIVEGYIRLRKAGATNYSGLCPFHKEKSPSFSVHAVRQFFHCFGCGVSGDVFTFVGKIENVGFPEAVKIVAQKCGIPLPKQEYSSPEQAAEARLRGKLLELHETAAAWFEEQLRGPEGAVAREYLAGRGLTADGIKKFRIGYAPDSFNALRDRLSGVADAETLRASGLFSSKEQGDGTQGPLYDRFRKRVMFPIANESGRVIAFTARTLESGEKAGPKYINSPETPLYSKGHVLFNLDKAKTVIRQAGFALLVEGQMDCIRVYLSGIQNVIATSGTAMTEQQIAMWKRQLAVRGSDRVRVVANFDPDTAGQNAAAKTVDLLIEENFEIKIVILEDGLDPDRFIRERGIEAYVRAIKGAARLEDFLIDRARLMFPGSNSEQKVKQMNYLLPYIRRMPQMLAREQFAIDAAQKLGIPSASMREELRQAALKRRESVQGKSSSVADVPSLPSGWVSAGQWSERERNKRLAIQAAAARQEGIESVTDFHSAPVVGELSLIERILIRALSVTDPADEEMRRIAADALAKNPSLFQKLPTFSLLQSLVVRAAQDPMEAIKNEIDKTMLAKALFSENAQLTNKLVIDALAWHEAGVIEQELREIRFQMQEAAKNGNWSESLKFADRKMALDRRLDEIKRN